MGNKYIIELEDKPFHNEDGDSLCRVKGFNSLVFDMTGISKLAHYHEPDLEQVRKEAYEEGYKTAKIQCGIQAEKDMREVGKRHYQRGLSDAWEAARKISSMNSFTRDEIFGLVITSNILDENTAAEIIEKLKAHEQKHEEIEVGDEVITASGKAVVTGVWPIHFEYDNADGSHGFDKVKNVKKTGRHFPEIAAVLEKMRKGQE